MQSDRKRFFYPIMGFLLLVIFQSSNSLAAISLNGSYETSDPVTYSSVTWADVNGDGYADLVGANDDLTDVNGNLIRGRVYCFNVRTNLLLWNFPVYHDQAPNHSSAVLSTPTVADLDGQPGVEIIFGVGYTQVTNGGAIFILNHLGQEVFYYDDFEDMNNNGYPDGVFSTVAVGDINRDGDQDFVFGGFDQRVYAFTYNQSFSAYLRIWDFHCGDTIYSSPALANIDDDPYLEIMIGIPVHVEVDTANTNFTYDIEYDGGMLLVLNHDGTLHPDFLASPGNPNKPKTYTSQTIRSSPAVADIDNDGYFEIIHTTSAYRTGFHGRCGPNATTPAPQPYVYAWNHDGTRAWNPWPSLGALPSDACDSSIINDSESAPAIGDINMDGILDVVVGQRSANGTAKVWVLRGTDGANIGPYPLLLTDRSGTSTPVVGIRSNPVITNIDSDEQPEILLGVLNDIMILDRFGYSTGNHVCLNQGGTADCIYTDVGGQVIYQTAGIWNGDDDANLEIGMVHRFVDASVVKGKISVWDTGVAGPSSNPGPWPMFRQNSRHTGLYDVTAPGQILDLAVEKISDQTVRLSWTAPGHNNYVGCAFSYEIRYTVDTPFDWNTATPINHGLLPQVAGTSQSIDTDVLGTGSAYYFGIVALDEAGNISDLSNIATLNLEVPTLAPLGIAVLLLLISLALMRARTSFSLRNQASPYPRKE